MYVIYYKGIFQAGYVKHVFWTHNKNIPMSNPYEAARFATKFRFKFIAEFWCKVWNWVAERNCEFRIFEVRKINKKMEIEFNKKPELNPSHN